MNKTKFILLAVPFMTVASMTGCTEKYDVKLVVYNWADYIYDGTDDDGNVVDKSVVKRFAEYYREKTGLKVKVDYRTFATNEEMYTKMNLGSIKPDLICPSDYMIQKLANEDKLEKFSYNEADDKYAESLENWETYGSPFIKERFKSFTLSNGSSFLQYAVPYFWGTMGFTYDPSHAIASGVHSWECLWNTSSAYHKEFSLKDSMRDTYVAGIFHVYKDEIAAIPEDAENYNEQLSAIFNRCDNETIAAVEQALIAAKNSTVAAFEVDEGKDEIVKGTYHANLAWSGDSVYSMDSAEEDNDLRLCYALPDEGSNVWFDGWCMPKGANKELAEEFVNFISLPEIAALSMDYVGYTSPVVGEEIWDLVNEKYAAEEGATDVYETDLSFYFGDTVDGGATIKVLNSEKGRQFDAQYPTQEQLKKCCIMKDFGAQEAAVKEMWVRVKAA